VRAQSFFFCDAGDNGKHGQPIFQGCQEAATTRAAQST